MDLDESSAARSPLRLAPYDRRHTLLREWRVAPHHRSLRRAGAEPVEGHKTQSRGDPSLPQPGPLHYEQTECRRCSPALGPRESDRGLPKGSQRSVALAPHQVRRAHRAVQSASTTTLRDPHRSASGIPTPPPPHLFASQPSETLLDATCGVRFRSLHPSHSSHTSRLARQRGALHEIAPVDIRDRQPSPTTTR